MFHHTLVAEHYVVNIIPALVPIDTYLVPKHSLVPRPLPDFISQLWRKIDPIFLHSCEIKSGNGLGTRLPKTYNNYLYEVNVLEKSFFQCPLSSSKVDIHIPMAAFMPLCRTEQACPMHARTHSYCRVPYHTYKHHSHFRVF